VTARLLAAALVLAAASPALADDEPPCPIPEIPAESCALHLNKGATTTGGLILPPGYYLHPEAWDKLDTEVRRLQEAETRLTAERDSYRKAARPTWWWTATAIGTVGAGIVTTWLMFR
jgi:hypothetical protein